MVNKKVSKYLNSVDVKIPLDDNFALNAGLIRKSIQQKIKINDFDFRVVLINTSSNQIDLIVCFQSLKGRTCFIYNSLSVPTILNSISTGWN